MRYRLRTLLYVALAGWPLIVVLDLLMPLCERSEVNEDNDGGEGRPKRIVSGARAT
jgi:hypothetical protein